MDKLSTEQRHATMAAIRSKDTKPEWIVRRGLWSRGFRYRLNHKRLPGHPDLVLRKYRTCIFVNGCFWHQHGCKLTSRPKSNSAFWDDKFTNNIVRDIKTNWKLSLLGYRVATIWECSIKGEFERTIERLVSFKKAYGRSVDLLDGILKRTFPEKTDEERRKTLVASLQFLHGVYPYAHATPKQIEAMDAVGIRHDNGGIYELSLSGLKMIIK